MSNHEDLTFTLGHQVLISFRCHSLGFRGLLERASFALAQACAADRESPHWGWSIRALKIINPSIGDCQSKHWGFPIRALKIVNPCIGDSVPSIS